MTQNGRDAAFTEYVTAAGPWLRKVAYLLCRDWHRADDLVQISITRLYVHWHRASRVENVDGYARAILVNAYLAEQRSPWWKRVVVHRDPIESEVLDFDADTSMDLRNALASVPPRQRATLVLRYFCDLSVEQTASALNCSTGTVKSQTSRGLEAIRRFLEAHPVNP